MWVVENVEGQGPAPAKPPTMRVETAAAQSLLFLAKEHKAQCQDPDCPVMLGTLIGIYQEFVGRGLTDDELRAFV
jgi:hypothetical protein